LISTLLVAASSFMGLSNMARRTGDLAASMNWWQAKTCLPHTTSRSGKSPFLLRASVANYFKGQVGDPKSGQGQEFFS
jgi:hypothetical protein